MLQFCKWDQNLSMLPSKQARCFCVLCCAKGHLHEWRVHEGYPCITFAFCSLNQTGITWLPVHRSLISANGSIKTTRIYFIYFTFKEKTVPSVRLFFLLLIARQLSSSRRQADPISHGYWCQESPVLKASVTWCLADAGTVNWMMTVEE